MKVKYFLLKFNKIHPLPKGKGLSFVVFGKDPTNLVRIAQDKGLFSLFYALESDKFKQRFGKRTRMAELRQTLKDSAAELSKLTGKNYRIVVAK
jgi:hypothetical protein